MNAAQPQALTADRRVDPAPLTPRPPAPPAAHGDEEESGQHGPGSTARQRVRFSCAPEPCAVGQVRRLIGVQLARWQLEAYADAVMLVASELITNAIEHAEESGVDVRLERGSGRVVIAVRDGSPGRPAPQGPDPLDERGRGLQLVQHLAEAWGTCMENQGKTVWASFTISDANGGGIQ